MTDTIDRTPPEVHLHIGDEQLVEGSAGRHGHVNPCNGEVDREIPMAGPAEVDRAVQAAQAAYETWKRTPPSERRRLLLRLGDLIEANTREFARLGALDNGTPLLTTSQFPTMSAEWTRYYAGWADKIHSDVTASLRDDGELGYTLAQPYGVIGIIITWNGPLISLAMKIPAALTAGNTVVVKPSELTPFTGELFMQLVREAGFPPGVVNLLPGDPAAGAALVEHELVQKVSFTGGPATAQKILESCARQMKPSVMELGGKSANIVFDDADLDASCFMGTFMSVGAMSGQGCAFPTRMLVHRPIYEEMVERISMVAKGITVGDPFGEGMIAGPVVNEAALERILGMIERARSGGARLVVGGNRLDGDLAQGYFIAPTVFADVDPQSELAQNEVFGPVLAVTPFADEDEAIAIANATKYGLSAYVQTKDLRRALRVAEELVTGEVLVNGARNLAVHRPFGGLGKSGFGKEGGRAGIEEFLRTKSVGIM
ncbi:MAG TPA: aldehyde dehydrogenase family protein [Acidimicrobiales bacterium]|nr:aldehyde dehydrogenase family protein [Acidimicrobiales bacterium]